MRVCGQSLSDSVVRQIQDMADTQGSGSRRALARRVCELLDWRTAKGDFAEGSCRKALARLGREGTLRLRPAAKGFAFERKVRTAVEVSIPELCCELSRLGDICISRVGDRRSRGGQVWKTLIDRFHYLGVGRECGGQIRYLIESPEYGYLGAASFRSGMLSLAQRDRHIGWSECARVANIDRVVLNSRFLILPSVHVKNLASHSMSLILSRLSDDWEERYGRRPVLVETFVDGSQFEGTCYKAGNWSFVGQTSGRRDGQKKDVYLYPLCGDWREQLCVEPPVQLRIAPALEEPASWAHEEFATCRFEDERLKERLYRIAQDFYNRPLGNIPEACQGYAATKGSYRFFSNDKVSMNALLTPHVESTIRRIREHSVVLAPQDTTTLNYCHPGTDGLGPTGTTADTSVGMILHDTLAFTPDGTPLGVVDAQCWARDPAEMGKSKRRKDVPIEQKESIKWINSYRKVAQIQQLCPDTMLVSMGDRESDIYELLVEARNTSNGPKILIRCDKARQRRIVHESEKQLWSLMKRVDVAGSITIHIPKRPGRAARDVELNVRYSPVTLNPPVNKDLPRLEGYWAVYVSEERPPGTTDAIEWMLLTDVEVADFADAKERVEWYTGRWGIEVYHRTLKSGCKILSRQLGTAQALEACLGVDMVVAWRIYHLTMLGREIPTHPCTVFFEDVEWKALYCHANRTTTPPSEPPTLVDAIKTVGKLGGHLGRSRDGMPGTQCIWRGIQRLDMATDMFVIFTGGSPPKIRESYPHALNMSSGP